MLSSPFSLSRVSVEHLGNDTSSYLAKNFEERKSGCQLPKLWGQVQVLTLVCHLSVTFNLFKPQFPRL